MFGGDVEGAFALQKKREERLSDQPPRSDSLRGDAQTSSHIVDRLLRAAEGRLRPHVRALRPCEVEFGSEEVE